LQAAMFYARKRQRLIRIAASAGERLGWASTEAPDIFAATGIATQFTPTTLDPATVTSGALSNGNLTFAGTPGIGGAAATKSHASNTGKWYVEIQLVAKGDNGSGVDGFGVAGPTATFANLSTGVATHGCICYINSGDIYINGSHVGNVNGSFAAPSAGNVFGIGIDTGANTMQIQNLTTGGPLVTGLALPAEASFKPACCIDDASSGSSWTFNFGATAFTGTLPAGYSAWG
jgi:hypothetical protein